MRRIIYIGSKPIKADNVAQTGLTWARGEIHDVVDEKAALKLLEHSHVWADANTDYKMTEPELAIEKAAPEPRVMIVPQGGIDVSPYWEPITIPVPGEVFKSLQDKETIAVFMSPEDADNYEVWKKEQSGEFDPATADKRSKEYREWQKAQPKAA